MMAFEDQLELAKAHSSSLYLFVLIQGILGLFLFFTAFRSSLEGEGPIGFNSMVYSSCFVEYHSNNYDDVTLGSFDDRNYRIHIRTGPFSGITVDCLSDV